MILKKDDVAQAESIASDISEIFNKYPYWKASEEYERKLKQEVLKIFTKIGMDAKKSVKLATKILTMLKGASE